MKTQRKLVAVLLGAGMLAGSPAAVAQDTPFYAGLSVGQAEVLGLCNDVQASVGVAHCDATSLAWKALGGYQFSRYLGAEVGYSRFGRITFNGTAGNLYIKSSALEAVGIGAYPLNREFSVFAKLGVFNGSQKQNSTVAGLSKDHSSNDLTWGLGLRYDITREFAVRAEYQRYEDIDIAVKGLTFLLKW